MAKRSAWRQTYEAASLTLSAWSNRARARARRNSPPRISLRTANCPVEISNAAAGWEGGGRAHRYRRLRRRKVMTCRQDAFA